MSQFEASKKSNLSLAVKQNEQYRMKLKERIEQIKQDVVSTNREVINRQTLYHSKVVDNLRSKTEQIYSTHHQVTNRLNKEAIKREVNVRVNRGLESLEEFISVLRMSNWSDLAIENAIKDPAISSTPGEKIRRFSISKFITSIQRQLIEQTEFVNIAAHELRTPIMPIVVNAEILDQELGGREEVKTIMRNALRLQRLAQNILDVARLNAGSLLLQKIPFRLNDLIREIVEDETMRLAGNGMRIDFRETEKIDLVADRDKVGQVLTNLVENAIKFAQRGLIIITAVISGNNALLSVQDNGQGISKDTFSVLFSRFGKNSYTGTGLGLGLYISKGIVEAHGGSIFAKNREPPETGAVLSFSIPLR